MLQQITWSKVRGEKECMNVKLHRPCLSLLLSTRINSQWHSIASAVLLWPVLLWPVSVNQLSELFAGFCIGWVTCLEGKLKFALKNATLPLLLCLTFSCSHHPSVSSVFACCTFCPAKLGNRGNTGQGLKVCLWEY